MASNSVGTIDLFPNVSLQGVTRVCGTGPDDLSAVTQPTTQALAISSNPLTAIDWGTKIETSTIDVYFAPAGTYIDGYTGDGPALGWTDFQRNQLLSVLSGISKFANVEFNVVGSPDGAELRLGSFDLSSGGYLGFGVPPGEPYAGYVGLDYDFLRWADYETGQSMLNKGGFTYAVVLEEIGHALGLAHMHDDGGTSTILTGVTQPVGSYGIGGLCQGVYSVMNYDEGWPGGPYGSSYLTNSGGDYTIWINDYGYEGTMMAIDLAVLQEKYGPNPNSNLGDSTYVLPDQNWTGTAFQCIWDTGGTDTIRYDGSRSVTIDLRAATLKGEVGGGGYVSYAAPIRGGYTIAHGVVIENAVGGAGADRLTGNGFANSLKGSGGSDVLASGSGADILNGGGGNDTMVGGDGNDSYYVDSAGDVVAET
ncbi:M10 family metallopeptidase C-terminal domain-containing protein, partial [Tabrizicola sp. J26]|uniref:M10 family metallopeptidase C-terminal domain-containing protein n=1 Tax=Alitabrizicola rongguiensis TaxID=2909234 RepID=UPI001F246045